MTDGAQFYRAVGKVFAHHEHANHHQGEYTKPSKVASVTAHSNTLESYFSILKRGITGMYHHVSKEHLQW